MNVYYSQLEAHIKRVRILQKLVHNLSLSAEISLQDIEFQSCRLFLCPKRCTKNAPNLAPTHSYGRFQIPHAPQIPSSHAQYNKVISVSKIPLVHFFDRWKTILSYTFLYSFGDFPVIRLKYLPKTDCEGKLRWSLICWIVIFVERSRALISVIT